MIPEPIMRGTTGNTTIGELVLNLAMDPRYAHLYEPDQDYLLGFFIPPFQRPHVWDQARSIRFVESAWLGIHLGTYVANSADDIVKSTGKFPRQDGWLIDGQQRLRALDGYFRDRYPVFGTLFSELTTREKRRFGQIVFARTTIREGDEQVLRELYNRLNFGGVAHTKNQRA